MAGLGGGEEKKEEAGGKGKGEKRMERLTCRERKEKDKGLYRATEWETCPKGGKRADIHLRLKCSHRRLCDPIDVTYQLISAAWGEEVVTPTPQRKPTGNRPKEGG